MESLVSQWAQISHGVSNGALHSNMPMWEAYGSLSEESGREDTLSNGSHNIFPTSVHVKKKKNVFMGQSISHFLLHKVIMVLDFSLKHPWLWKPL
jgi:hypothetical protein